MARQRKFDVVGFCVLALTASLGGGIVRDTMLQQGPPAAIQNPVYLAVAIAGGLIAWLTNLDGKWWEIIRVHGDAVVLGVWAVTGSMKAMSYGMPWESAILMGVITAVGGGMIRDIIIGQIPAVFGGNTLYAIPALLSSVIMVAFFSAGHSAWGMIIAAVMGAALASVSALRGWHLGEALETSPVHLLSSLQLKRALRRAERRGFQRGKQVQQIIDEQNSLDDNM